MSTALALRLAPGRSSYPLLSAVPKSTSQMWALTTGTIGALGRVVTPQGRAQLHSVVGITRYSADAVDTGYADYLSILAFISLSLAIFNLLPFLPLDGGHVLMIALEKVRGRAVSRAVFERISAVGHRADAGCVRDRASERPGQLDNHRAALSPKGILRAMASERQILSGES